MITLQNLHHFLVFYKTPFLSTNDMQQLSSSSAILFHSKPRDNYYDHQVVTWAISSLILEKYYFTDVYIGYIQTGTR